MKISCSEFNVFVFTNCARQSVNIGTAGLLIAVEVACALPCDDGPFDDAQGSSIHLVGSVSAVEVACALPCDDGPFDDMLRDPQYTW